MNAGRAFGGHLETLANFALRAFSVFAVVVLAGCVANSTLPSQNINALLTPEATPAAPVDPNAATPLESQLTPTVPTPQTAAASDSKLSPAVKSAIAPASTDAKAAEAATTLAKTDQTAAAQTGVEKKSAAATPTAPQPKKVITPTANPNAKPEPKKKSLLATLFSGGSQPDRKAATSNKRKTTSRSRSGSFILPGVRKRGLFGVEDEDIEELDQPVKVAGVTNLARRGTHGLLLQRKDVKVGCFPRKLLSILKRVERRFGRTPIVTSGYRSRAYNRRIRGARNSMHIHCKAADIQVKGVSKWTLAKYLRTIPGRGGVGTYCHTASVHIDIGSKRDWNRRCRRKRTNRTRKS